VVAVSGQRFNMYTDIHKGVRRALFEAVMLVGSLDLSEAEGMAEAQGLWEELKALLREHVDNERQYVHPLYEAAMPGVARALTVDHEVQEAFLGELEGHFARLAARPDPAGRVTLGLEFYRRLNLFLGDYLPHLQREEGLHMRNLWDLYTDEELGEVVARILNAETPEAAARSGRFILLASNHQDRMAFMGAVGAGLKPPVMAQMQQLAQQLLPPHELAKMAAAAAGHPPR
jgi:hypothetical protein